MPLIAFLIFWGLQSDSLGTNDFETHYNFVTVVLNLMMAKWHLLYYFFLFTFPYVKAKAMAVSW